MFFPSGSQKKVIKKEYVFLFHKKDNNKSFLYKIGSDTKITCECRVELSPSSTEAKKKYSLCPCFTDLKSGSWLAKHRRYLSHVRFFFFITTLVPLHQSEYIAVSPMWPQTWTNNLFLF